MRILYLNKKLKRLKSAYKRIGFKNLLKKAIYARSEELMLEKDLSEEATISFKNKLKIQSIEKKHMDVLLKLYKQSGIYDGNPTSYISRYFKNNCKCFIATINNNFIGHIWWGNNKMSFEFDDPDFKFIRDEIELKDDDVYMWDFFIVSKERGSGISIELLSKVFLAIKKLGYNRIVGFVPVTEVFIPARWTYKLLGCKEIKRIVVRKFFTFLVFKGKRLYFNREGFNELCWNDDGTQA